jgi:hypothetical protein
MVSKRFQYRRKALKVQDEDASRVLAQTKLLVAFLTQSALFQSGFRSMEYFEKHVFGALKISCCALLDAIVSKEKASTPQLQVHLQHMVAGSLQDLRGNRVHASLLFFLRI